jgi:parvulin-like peptidyl-prolyl isomerase
MNWLLGWVVVLGAAGGSPGAMLASCRTGPVLAVAGPDTLFRTELQIQLALEGGVELTPENIRPLLENWTHGMLLYREALRQGLGQDETTQALIGESERQYLIAQVTRRYTDTVRITDNEVYDYYNRRKLDFASRLRLLYMVLPDEKAARQTVKDLGRGQPFLALAAERSLDRAANPGAELAISGRGDTLVNLDPALEDTLFTLVPEKLSGPIRVGTTWWLVKLQERTPTGPTPELAAVRGLISRHLELRRRRKALEAAISGLTRKAKVVTSPPRGDTSGFLARVNDAVLTRAYLRLQLQDQAEVKESDIPRLKEIWTKAEILHQEARRLGLHRGETTSVLFTTKRRDFLTNALVEQMLGRVTVAPTEAFDYFQQHKSEFLNAVRILHILAGSESLAQVLLEQVRKGADFAGLARERSFDRAEAQGRESSPLDRLGGQSPLPVELENAVFAMKPGEVSPVLRTNQGYWIVKVTDRTPVRSDVAFEQAREHIVQFLHQLKSRQVLDQLLDDIRRTAPTRVFPENFWN